MWFQKSCHSVRGASVAKGWLGSLIALVSLGGCLEGTPPAKPVGGSTWVLESKGGQAWGAGLSVMERGLMAGSPGAFWPLKTARVGMEVRDTLAGAVDRAERYVIAEGAFPAGLTLDEASGLVTGKPEQPGVYEFVVGAVRGGEVLPIRAWMAVFSGDESEVVRGQDFSRPGPNTVVRDQKSFTYVSSFNVEGFHPTLGHPRTYTVDVLTYYPSEIARMGKLPVLIFQHATGFGFDEYHDLLGRVAAHGYIVVTAAEYHSYIGNNRYHPDRDDYFLIDNAVAGMEEGSATQEALIGFLERRDATPSEGADPLRGKVDFTKLVMMGHSRGGGSTHASHARGLNLAVANSTSGASYGLRGVIYCQGYDLRAIPDDAQPPGIPPVYSIPDQENRIPFLELSSEMDADLVYPATDTIIERSTGPATQVTLYGANHNQMGDAHADDGPKYITRAKQHEVAAKWIVAFLKRWCDNDLSLEGFLYGNESMGSNEVAQQARRNLSGSVLVEDFQDEVLETNALGLQNQIINTNLTLETSNIYPIGFYSTAPGLGSLNMKSGTLRFAVPASSSPSPEPTTYTSSFVTGMDPNLSLASARRFIFRIGVEVRRGPAGYDQMTLDLILTDGKGRPAQIRLFDPNAQSTAWLPDYTDYKRRFERTVQVEVPLQRFVESAAGAFDATSIQRIEYRFEFKDTLDQSYVWLDDLRFE